MALTQISTNGIKNATIATADIADDAVTADKLANSINTEIAANTAKTTNATHSGEVTGATALTIADDVVDEANLKADNSPTNDYVLTAKSSAAGGLTWAAASGGLSDLVGDTSPQLGGDLDTNSFEISLDDSHAVKFGDSADLQIYHDGSHSYIKDVGTGQLRITSDSNIWIEHGAENMIVCKGDDAVEFYYDNVKKLETTSDGATVSGSLKVGDNNKIKVGDGADLQLYHNGTDSFIKNFTGITRVLADDFRVLNQANDEVQIKAIANGAVNLYHNGVTKFETNSDGGQVTGALKVKVAGTGYGDGLILEDNDSTTKSELTHVDGTLYISADASTNHLTINSDGHVSIPNDSDKLRLGASQDLELYHDGTNSQIENSQGDLNIKSDVLRFRAANDEQYITAIANGTVELYHNNVKKAETSADGFSVNGVLLSSGNIQINNDTGKIRLGASQDLEIYHDGTDSYIKNTTNDLIIECTGDDVHIKAADDVFLKVQGSEAGIDIHGDAGVSVYYDGSKKLETTNGGITVSGDVKVGSGRFYSGSADEMMLYNNGTYSKVRSNGDELRLEADSIVLKAYSNADVALKTAINGTTELYYNNSKKFETTSGGATVTGDLTVTGSVIGVDLTKVRRDLNALALQFAVKNNSTAFNLPNSFIDQFEDDTGLSTQTNVDRHTTDEYVASVLTIDGLYRYWRIYKTSGASGGGHHRELELHKSGSKVTVTAAMLSQNDIPGWNASQVVDNDTSTIGFHTDDADSGAWIKVDFGSGNEQSIDQWRAYIDTAGGGGPNSCTWNIQYSSDDSNWTTALTGWVTDKSNSNGAGTWVAGGTFTAPATTLNNSTGTLIGPANTASDSRSKVSGVLLYKDATGTASVGTDIEVYFTCNGGTNWTEAASYTTETELFSTGIKQVSLGETTCTAGTDVRYKIVWANQGSGSKVTQAHGIGINY